MSTPSRSAPPGSLPPGVSASSGINLGNSVTVDAVVVPKPNKDVMVTLNCKGRIVVVTYKANGNVIAEVQR